MTFVYDAISFLFRRNGDNAFSIIAHATTAMDANQLRNTADYLKALAENREARR